MARTVTTIGQVASPIKSTSKLTFDFDPSNPNALKQFPLEMFPWGYTAKANAVEHSIPTQLKSFRTGNYLDVHQHPLGIGSQDTINDELQYYIREFERIQYNLPILKEVVDGVLEMRCIQTPDNFKDVAMTPVDTHGDFPIISSDKAAGTITVAGLRYERKRPSDEGTYIRANYVGFSRYHRDELTSDPDLDLSWKRRKYDYGWITVQPSSNGDDYRKVKYTMVTDSHPVDPLESDLTSTTHVITIEPGQLVDADWDNIIGFSGGVIKLHRRLPWIAPMMSTGGEFSQKYFISEAVLKLDNHAEQFFALWNWGNYLEIYDLPFEFSNINNFTNMYSFDDKAKNATELDQIEWPGGGDWYTKHHNIHAAGIGGMLNYADIYNHVPVMDIGPEWDKDNQAGHAIAIARGALGFVDYGEFFKLRVEWLPPNHEDNPRDIGIVKWYIGPEFGELRYLCGVITPPWWDTDPGVAKQFFVNNGVGGNFINDSEFFFSVGLNSNKRTDTITNYLKSLKVWQIEGQVTGGKGYPDYDLKMGRGFQPSTYDLTGNSGTGVVVAPQEPVDPGTGGGEVTPPIGSRQRILIEVHNEEASTNTASSPSRTPIIKIGPTYAIDVPMDGNTEGYIFEMDGNDAAGILNGEVGIPIHVTIATGASTTDKLTLSGQPGQTIEGQATIELTGLQRGSFKISLMNDGNYLIHNPIIAVNNNTGAVTTVGGLISELATLTVLPASVWVDFPIYTTFTELIDFVIYDSNNTVVTDSFDIRKDPVTGVFQLFSLTAKTNLTIQGIGK